MARAPDNSGPSYISSHSADVILSDIRPIKLKIEALRSINVLLDEFLHSILSTACSLSTDKLRASLLSLLPTTLGKEALLEAEVELRAYWDRTAPADVTILDDDSKTFHLQWAFELLRLKCEAYSTLNESDEDHGAEGRINDMMSSSGGTPPKASLMAPAALYLTAILEAVCEHILSNVGRVTARDSSRTSATVHDLFVALCEDHSVYDLFKTMKVYEQIEQLSKASKVRRSKSFTRNDRSLRTGSPHQDVSTNSPRDRISSEQPGAVTSVGTTAVSTSGSRSSFEKARAMKMFKANNRSSFDGDVPNAHTKTDSVVSESSRHTSSQPDEGSPYEDQAMQQEFDDLMRTSSTMKVSLTPDRLKTMEVYKQEKDQRGNRRPTGVPPLSFKAESDPPVLPPRATGRRPSLLRVDSIKEDEEEGSSPPLFPTRSRQSSVSTPPSSSKPLPSRVRSISTTDPSPVPRVFAKLAHSPTPHSSSHTMPVPSPSMQPRRTVPNGQDPFPPRTRKVQKNRESFDLDDVMGDSDDEEIPAPKSSPKVRSPGRAPHAVSSSTRDLMEFLAEGPPGMGGPGSGFSTDIPQNANKPKSAGRLQRMISKLSLSNTDRSRGSEDAKKSPQLVRTPPPHSIHSKSSMGNLSSLANRPIPPRPPISPPASSDISSDDLPSNGARSRSASVKGRDSPANSQLPAPPVPTQREHSGSVSSNRRQPLPQPELNGHTQEHNRRAQPPQNLQTQRTPVVENVPPAHSSPLVAQSKPETPASQITAKEKTRPPRSSPPAGRTTPAYKPPPASVDNDVKNSCTEPYISCTQAQDIHSLLARATTADECRLIFDMFLAKSRIPIEPTNSSPSSTAVAHDHSAPADEAIETGIVELFLGGEDALELFAKRRVRKRSKSQLAGEPILLTPPGRSNILSPKGPRLPNNIINTTSTEVHTDKLTTDSNDNSTGGLPLDNTPDKNKSAPKSSQNYTPAEC